MYNYLQTHQVVYIKSVQLFVCQSYFKIKWFNKIRMRVVKRIFLRTEKIQTHLCVNANFSIERWILIMQESKDYISYYSEEGFSPFYWSIYYIYSNIHCFRYCIYILCLAIWKVRSLCFSSFLYFSSRVIMAKLGSVFFYLNSIILYQGDHTHAATHTNRCWDFEYNLIERVDLFNENCYFYEIETSSPWVWCIFSLRFSKMFDKYFWTVLNLSEHLVTGFFPCCRNEVLFK